jgi:hypothetical protein
MPYPNVTSDDLLAAMATLARAAGDVGEVATEERHLEMDEWAAWFMEANEDNSVNGVMIIHQGLAYQTKGPRIGTIQEEHQFSWEFVTPFEANADDGVLSVTKARDKFTRVNDELNRVPGKAQPWNLGITTPGSDVEHQFLQLDTPLHVKQLGKAVGGKKVHYSSYTLRVKVVVMAKGKPEDDDAS